MRKYLLALVGLLLIGATGCSASSQPDEVGVQYDDGPIASKKFEECIDASERNYHGIGDQAYLYPASQSNVVFDGSDDADAGRITFVTKDGIEMSVSGVLNFRLNTDCTEQKIDGKTYKGGVLQYFHELIGNRYKAYDEDGSRSDAWGDKVLAIYLAKPLDTAIDRAGQQYTYLELYGDAAKKALWEQDVLDLLPALVDRQTDGDVTFFQDYALTLQKPDPPKEIKAALLAKQEAIAKADAATAQAAAEETAALAEVKVAQAEATKQQAIIAGFGSFQNYIMYVMSQVGLNPLQPQYVVGGTAPPKDK